MSLWKFLALVSLLSTSGCASYFIRKECDKVDWFAHGQAVAMSGKRLSGNPLVKRCEDAEANVDQVGLDRGFKTGMANYCKPETVLATGKNGEYFSTDMCDGENIRLLKTRHAEGVKTYCQKSNGYAAGARGIPYNQICPKELEDAFLPEFRRGRKTFLSAEIRNIESSLIDTDSDIRTLERRRDQYRFEYQAFGDTRSYRRTTVYDPVLKRYREETSFEEDPSKKMEKDQALSRMRGVESEIRDKEEQIKKLRDKRRELSTELTTL